MKITEIGVTWIDYPSKENCAVIVYFLGCIHNCEGCQNEQFQDYNLSEGILFSVGNEIEKEEGMIKVKEIANFIKNECERNFTNKIVFSGGDPFHQGNVKWLKHLILELKNYEICVYTGYEKEFIEKLNREEALGESLREIDFIKTGKYFPELKDGIAEKTDEYIKFITKNQRLYKVNEANLELVSRENYYYFDK